MLLGQAVHPRCADTKGRWQVEAGVFQQVFIPGTLDDVVHLERDLGFAATGQTDLLYYQVGQP